MTRALFSHMWRLSLGVHPLSGLPRSDKGFGAWVLLAVASVVVAYLRHGSVEAATTWALILGALAYLSLRVSSALALLSVGIDALSIAIPAAPSWFWLTWETSAQTLIFYRAMKGKTNDR